MAFHLCLSNSLEKLADEFIEKICRPLIGKDPFAPVYGVVPNAGMAAFLKRHLAQYFGIAANAECQFLQKFIFDTIGKFFSAEENELFHKSINFWSPDVLSWRIDSILEAERGSFPGFTAYWAAGKEDPAKRHLLSCELAQCFDRYQLYRSSCISPSKILSSWRDGKNLNSEQGILYHKLCSFSPDPDSFYCKFFSAGNAVSPLPESVGVFGIGSMSALHIHCLKKFSEHTEIFLFSPSPCQVYWGDMKSRRESMIELKKNPDHVAEILENSAGNNQLLADFGVVGREFFNLLLDTDCYTGEAGEALYIDPAPEEKGRALQIFQSDILNARVRNEANQIRIAPDDHSIRVNCCSSPRRELEILHDQLLELFYAGSNRCSDQKSFKVSGELRPEDVIVMFPDINKAAPMIDAVFSAGPLKGKYAICDRSTAGQSQLFECFSRLLDLPKSRCTSEEIIELLEFECLSSKLGLTPEDITAASQMVSRSRINWGLDEKEHEKFRDTPFVEFSWQDGIDRLLAEYARGEDASVIFSESETGGIDGRNAEICGIIANFISLLKEWRTILYLPRTAAHWEELFFSWINTFFSGGNKAYLPEISALNQALSKIARNAAAADENTLIDPTVFIERLKSEYSLPGGKQHFLRDKITFCSLVPLRAVPAKVIAILGLNDGEFPGVTVPKTFDLLKTLQRNDPNLTNEGRYLFLEAIMAARKNLILSYVGFDNGQELAPAIPLGTVIDCLKKGFDADKETIPLKPVELDSLYQLRTNRQDSPEPTAAAELEPLPLPGTMSLRTLQRLLTKHCEAFFQLRYGFEYTDREKAAIATDDPEYVDPLDNSILLKALLAMRLAEIDSDKWLEPVKKARIIPVNGEKYFDLAQTVINSIPEELMPDLKELTACNCEYEYSDDSTPGPVKLYSTLAVKEKPDGHWHRLVLHCSKSGAEKILNFYLEHLLLSASFGKEHKITGKLIFLNDKVSYSFAPVDSPEEELKKLMAIALRSYSEPGPMPIFASASFAMAKDEDIKDISKAFIEDDMKYSKVIERFFTPENFADGEFENLARQIYSGIAGLEKKEESI